MTHICPVSRPRQIRLSLVAPSGSGKSTAANLLTSTFEATGLRVAVLKIADPLYRLQDSFYRIAQAPLAPGAQDQILLEMIATQLRRIDPGALALDFERRLADCDADIVLNDDLRDDETDAPRLRALGFRFIRIATREPVRIERLAGRNDPSIIEESPLDRQIARIPVDYAVGNSEPGTEALSRQLRLLADHLMASHPSQEVLA